MLEKIGNWTFETHLKASKIGLVLVHHIMGLDDYIRSVANQLSEADFSVAAVDLYRGKHAKNMDEAFALRTSLKRDDVLDGIGRGVKLLKSKLVSDVKVGTMGFCMGGGLALMAACNLGLDFCVDYYGMMENPDEVKNINGPILLVLASEDKRITPWAFQSFLPAASKHKKRVEVQLYPNVGHAFHTPGWEGYNEIAAKDAWSHTMNFLSGLSWA